MELPHIGVHCSFQGCNQLDFLPTKCSLCRKQFCNDHYKYEDHECPEGYKVDVRVPICPLCNQPVPSKRGLAPDLAVNKHMENNCQSKVKKSNKKCSFNGCKVKELIAIQCALCNLNFCLRHRHSTDHECKGMASARRENVLNGSIFKNWGNGSDSKSKNIGRNKTNTNSKTESSSNKTPGRNIQVSPSTTATAVRGSLSETANNNKSMTQNEEPNLSNESQISEDEALARAIALSLEDQNRNSSSSSKSLDCSIS